MSDLREKVARVLANDMGEIGEATWKFYLEGADAAIAIIRREVLEEAARVAESYEPRCDTCPSGVAHAIRALAEKPVSAEAKPS